MAYTTTQAASANPNALCSNSTMKLTLTYQGRVPARQRGKPGASVVKAGMRQQFHRQIKDQVLPLLNPDDLPKIQKVVGGNTFVSPVHSALRVAAELDVFLLVRPSKRPGGDADNRLKTIIDGLTRPANEEQLQGFTAQADGSPTFCLLDDDKLVTQVSVQTRRWYAETPTRDQDEVLAIITATFVPGSEHGVTAPIGSFLLLL